MIVLPIDKKSQPFVEFQHCKKVRDINVLDDNDYYIDQSIESNKIIKCKLLDTY